MAKVEKFTIVEKPEGKAIFRNLPGWRFDRGNWVVDDLQNTDFKLAKRTDLDFSNIPEGFYRSGVVGRRDVEFDEINFEDPRLLTGWTPGVTRGQYFSHNEAANLHGTDSIILLQGDELDADGRSTMALEEGPSAFTPVTVEYLKRNATTFAIETDTKFRKVTKFRGLALNGRELDGDVAGNTDTSLDEFKIVRRDSDVKWNVQIISGTNLSEIEDDIWQVTLAEAPVYYWDVQFTRPDLFRNELPFDTFLARQVDPGANGALNEGDYTVGYRGHWTEGLGVRVYLTESHNDYGRISYKPNFDAHILFNKDVRVTRNHTFANGDDDLIFYLPNFPVLDHTSYQDGELAGPLQLDTSSTTVEVNAVEWTRVDDVTAEAVGQQVYELDPLWGELKFGDGVNYGTQPVGDIEVDWTQVPLIQFDTDDSRELFDDPREDLDPQVNALRRGFLVLDNRRLVPYKITLSANGPIVVRTDDTCCYGPLDVPAGDVDDLLTVRARVLARGVPDVGVPNIPVKFKSINGLLDFTQEFSVTDGDGYAYTEAKGKSLFSEYIVSDFMYEPMDPDVVNYLNPDPDDGDLLPEVPPWGAHLSAADEIIVPERFDGNLADVYMLIQSIPSDSPGDLLDYAGDPLPPDDFLEPYDGKTRKGGITVVWSQTVAGAEEIVHPSASAAHPGNPEWTVFTFPIAIPTGDLITSYKVVIDRTDRIEACTTEDPILVSNQIEVCLNLSDEFKGQWKLPNLASPGNVVFLDNPPAASELSGSRISTAVYMTPNDLAVTEIQPSGGGAPIVQADVGTGIDIIGTKFATTEELETSIFIVKVDGSGAILAVKDITSDAEFIDATTIRVASLPTPPTEEYDIDYWIAVAGFHPEETTNVRRTATKLEIGAAP